MQCFAVWSPSARSVDLELTTPGGSRTTAMEPSEGGWWRSPGVLPEHGWDYAYRVDGGEPTPDPRSAWLPQGVDGPSRVFDAARHTWQDAGWRGPQQGRGTLGGVVYEMHVGTFTSEGTLDAAA